MAKKTVLALMYDFDKTLCTKDMQEYTFIPNLGMTPDEFWGESNKLAREQKMDRILAYMYLMIKKSEAAGQPIRRKDFVAAGSAVEFFPGLPEWFERINAFGAECGAQIEHYIISSGLREIINGSKLKNKFKEIYACEFHYNASGVADWPLLAVNYTTKTQFLFRINKGVLDVSDDDSLNKYVDDDMRRVPFRNMMYLGDGLTDVPCMKLVRTNGGCSIAVYQPRKRGRVEELIKCGRVNFIAPADYTDGSELDETIKQVIRHMIAADVLVRKTKKQQSEIAQDR